MPALVLVVFVAGAAWAFWRGDEGQRFLALQAVLPWLAALVLSWSAGMSTSDDRSPPPTMRADDR